MSINRDQIFQWQRARDWAQSKDPDSIVGIARDPCHCPMANCFNNLEPGRKFTITYDGIIEKDDGVCDLPMWIEMAILMIDEEDGTVSIERFREILDLNKPTPLAEILGKG